MNNKRVLIKNKGEIKCEIIVTVHSDDTNKDYLIFSTDKKGDDGELLLYGGSYIEENDCLIVSEIKDEKELDLLENIVKALKEVAAEHPNVNIFTDPSDI